jgi:hypothetical protein
MLLTLIFWFVHSQALPDQHVDTAEWIPWVHPAPQLVNGRVPDYFYSTKLPTTIPNVQLAGINLPGNMPRAPEEQGNGAQREDDVPELAVDDESDEVLEEADNPQQKHANAPNKENSGYDHTDTRNPVQAVARAARNVLGDAGTSMRPSTSMVRFSLMCLFCYAICSANVPGVLLETSSGKNAGASGRAEVSVKTVAPAKKTASIKKTSSAKRASSTEKKNKKKASAKTKTKKKKKAASVEWDSDTSGSDAASDASDDSDDSEDNEEARPPTAEELQRLLDIVEAQLEPEKRPILQLMTDHVRAFVVLVLSRRVTLMSFNQPTCSFPMCWSFLLNSTRPSFVKSAVAIYCLAKATPLRSTHSETTRTIPHGRRQ